MSFVQINAVNVLVVVTDVFCLKPRGLAACQLVDHKVRRRHAAIPLVAIRLVSSDNCNADEPIKRQQGALSLLTLPPIQLHRCTSAMTKPFTCYIQPCGHDGR